MAACTFPGWISPMIQGYGDETRYYAAGLKTTVEKWFWGPRGPGKIPQSLCS
jgi:hypothetical protein